MRRWRGSRSRSATARLPLASLAHLHVDSGRTQINREQGQRFLALKCNIEGRDMGSFVAEAQARVAAEVKLPEGYHLTWGGEFENQRRAMKRLAVIVPISVLVIFFLLYMTFRAVAAGAGGAARRAVRDRGRRLRALPHRHGLSVSSAVGFITLFGVSVMNGVLIVGYMRRAREAPGALAGGVLRTVARADPAGAHDGAAGVDRPFAGGAVARIGSDTQRPFAIVIVGGLIPATLLTHVPPAHDLPARGSLVRCRLARAPPRSSGGAMMSVSRERLACVVACWPLVRGFAGSAASDLPWSRPWPWRCSAIGTPIAAPSARVEALRSSIVVAARHLPTPTSCSTASGTWCSAPESLRC